MKLSTDILDKHITDIINFDISEKAFSENAKTAHIVPIFKKDTRTEKKELQTC